MSEQIVNEESAIHENPLVTFALIAYNQEEYIREAIVGALGQTYSPLEIILSDDCSSDRTFQIMQEMVQNYKGHHRLILNKNPINFGITRHINAVGEIVSGDYVVMAAGDDFSLPDRTKKLLNLCLSRNAMIVFSGFHPVSKNDELVTINPSLDLNVESKLYTKEDIKDGFYLGPSYLIKRNILTFFPAILTGIHHEDILFPIRVKMLNGTIAYTSEKLIKYSIGTGVTKNLQNQLKRDWCGALRTINNRTFALAHQILLDANKIGSPVSSYLERRLPTLLLELYFIERRWTKFWLTCPLSVATWRYKIYLIRRYSNL